MLNIFCFFFIQDFFFCSEIVVLFFFICALNNVNLLSIYKECLNWLKSVSTSIIEKEKWALKWEKV